ncbi:MAG: site-2 protease family protein [Candidatus Hadarchaeum sp.]
MYEDILFVVAMFILFWCALGLINRWFNLKKHGFSISPGVMMWRTKRGLNFIRRVGRAKGFWRVYGDFAVVAGIGLMVFVFINLMLNLMVLLTQPTAAVAGVQLVLPGLVPGLTPVAWIIAIATVLLVHEFAHGFLLSSQGLKIKSVGGMLVVAIPGAFVEPDEKQLSKAPILKRLRMYAAGAFSNVLFALLCLLIIVLLIVPKPGAYVYAVAKDYPADNSGVAPGMRIYSIGGVEINTPEDFERFMSLTKPGENVKLVTSAGEMVVTLAQHPGVEGRGYLGVALVSAFSRWNFVNPLFVLWTAMSELMGGNVFHPFVFEALVPWVVIDILKWVFVLNIGIGLFNLMPAVPLDGGYILRGILEKVVSEERAIQITRALSVVVLFIILANFLPYLW